MEVLITGGTGFVGNALVKELVKHNHRVILCVHRAMPAQQEVSFVKMPEQGQLLPADLISRVDAVVNLAGYNIAAGRWNKRVKDLILSSRLQVTRQIVQSMIRNRAAGRPYPRVLLNASAVGYYGCHASNVFDETSPPGEGFLAAVCRAWEQEAGAAEDLGVRVARCRFGIVLGAGGGVLEKIIMPYRWGLGGYIGDGKQWVSWIQLIDLVRIMTLALADERFQGAFNLCSPQAVTVAEMHRHLARVLGKTCRTRLPAWVAGLLFGDMAWELLLQGQRVRPKKLLEMQIPFSYPDIASALAASVSLLPVQNC